MPTLRVRLIEARNLNAADVNGLSDPYCVATVGGNKHKSRIIKADLNPRWEETFDIPVEVYDKDTFGSDDSLGTAEIALSDLVQGIEKPMWVSLKGGEVGENLIAIGQNQVMKQVAGFLGGRKKKKTGTTQQSTSPTSLTHQPSRSNKGQVHLVLTALDFGGSKVPYGRPPAAQYGQPPYVQQYQPPPQQGPPMGYPSPNYNSPAPPSVFSQNPCPPPVQNGPSVYPGGGAGFNALYGGGQQYPPPPQGGGRGGGPGLPYSPSFPQMNGGGNTFYTAPIQYPPANNYPPHSNSNCYSHGGYGNNINNMNYNVPPTQQGHPPQMNYFGYVPPPNGY